MFNDFDDSSSFDDGKDLIRHNDSAPPVPIPPGHVGPVVLPGSGRLIWWTGRVAIGLRHQPERYAHAVSTSALWVQDLMLSKRGSVSAAS